MAEDKSGKKMIAVNREVRHEYFVIEALETGIELVGTEVKSLRAGGVNLKDSWADIDDGELMVLRACTSALMRRETSSIKIRARPRRLLAHKAEIRRLDASRSNCRDTTLVPLSLYFKKGRGSSWSWACVRAKSCMTSVRSAARTRCQARY